MIEEEKVKKVGPIGERLKLLITHYHYNMNSLSVKLGIPSNSVITRIVNDPERGMSLDYIQRVLLNFPDVSPDWFLLGEGEMLRKDKSIAATQNNGPCKSCTEKDEKIIHLKEVLALKNELLKAREEQLAECRGDKSSGEVHSATG